MYHCRKTSLGSTILGAALAKIDCVTYCFKYLAKFVDQVDLCTGLEVGIPDSNQAGQVLLGVFGRLRYSHQIAPLTSREIIVYCQTVKEAWKKKTLEEGWVTLYWTSFSSGEKVVAISLAPSSYRNRWALTRWAIWFVSCLCLTLPPCFN